MTIYCAGGSAPKSIQDHPTYASHEEFISLRARVRAIRVSQLPENAQITLERYHHMVAVPGSSIVAFWSKLCPPYLLEPSQIFWIQLPLHSRILL